MKNVLKSFLLAACAVTLVAGCNAQGVDPAQLQQIGGGNNGVPPGSVGDTTGCSAPVSGLCVLGGPDHPGGLVDRLLAPDGPLGPIAGAIDSEALRDALTATLAGNGELVFLLQELIAEGQLQEGLTLLLLGADGDGMGAIAETLGNLLLPNEEGMGLISLLGEEGVAGLVMALLIAGTDPDACQAPLGTICLISGDGDQQGLVDLLLTSGGLAGALSPTLTNEVTDQLVDTLGNLLESNGALADLVTGLLMDGQLAEGLMVLLGGNPEDGSGGLVAALEGLTGGLGDIVGDVIDFLGNLLGGGGFLGGA